MQAFRVGDTVTLSNEENTLYVITDVNEYHVIQEDGTFKSVYDYETMRILPITNGIQIRTLEEDNLYLYAKHKTKMYNMMVEFIRKDRRSKNIFGPPEFLEIIENRLEELKEEHDKEMASTQPLQKVKREKKDKVAIQEGVKSMVGVVHYAKLKTVDDCLDRLNDLNMLIAMFKDDGHSENQETLDEYIKNKEVVTTRIQRLVLAQQS